MTVWTDRRDRGRGLASLAGGAALIVMALGATACASTPAGSTSLSAQQAAAAQPAADPLMTPVTVSMPPTATFASRPGGASPADGTPRATSPGGAAYPGSSAGPASAPAAQAVPSAPAVAPTSSQPEPAGSASASASASASGTRGTRGTSPGGSPSGSPGGSSGSSSGGSLSVSSSCTQVSVEVLESFSCPVTASGGTPGYGWTLFINGQLIAVNGTMPPGFETTVSEENGQDVTQTLEGKPELTGTYNVTVTAADMTPVNPPHTASVSFTIVVTPNPNVKTLGP